jgi:hypothetical protein
LAWLCNQANIQELTLSRLSVYIPDICIADIPTCAGEKAAGNECRLWNFTSFVFFFLSQQNRLAVSACLVNIQFSSRCCVALENCGSSFCCWKLRFLSFPSVASCCYGFSVSLSSWTRSRVVEPELCRILCILLLWFRSFLIAIDYICCSRVMDLLLHPVCYGNFSVSSLLWTRSVVPEL